MSKKTLTWLLIFSVIINVSTLATVAYHRWFKEKKYATHRSRSNHREYFAKKLGLTEQQTQQVQQLRAELNRQIKPLKTQLDEQRCHFFDILQQDSVNINEVYESINNISDIQKQMQQKTVENMLAHQSILTPEQRKIFFSLMAKRMQRGKSKRRYPPKSRENKNNNQQNEEKLP